mmetsp:Transcript_19799/g.61018  ORF Transcript_19799/g.61018 Transcript_19799/m.61018 type:complete len:224 (+) Transcript_19799:269-940(+)
MSAHVPRGPEDEVTPCEPWREDDSEDETDDGLPKWVEGDSLAPYVGTPPEVLDEAFKLADLTREDIVLDVGSGDGRIPTWAAARWGATRAYGLELEAPLVARATDEARRRGVADRTTFYECDVTKPFSKAADAAFEEATLITMYLLPEALDRVRPLIVRHLSGPMLPHPPDEPRPRRQKRILCIGWAPPDLRHVLKTEITLPGGGTCELTVLDASSLKDPGGG